ncbi:myb/SANT-like DNA-binding domain-containing protein 4 isoform X2 [Salmo salar]|uniref:Myb/SANT-like DNA-binding domain-containing protein 4 n=1 Tax=Salmo salar TaxID=8030 RepID=A0A1S3NUI7_SALSA|nr:myb/SANT-like DNA-binding domain-containing protein 4 isoform X2 [Salmo salar]|eukprot:XP_014018911.1 PREDICTED: myb/SANT-like DNA-binding domain-containing protein 4 isoform X2 [Salmo salar]
MSLCKTSVSPSLRDLSLCPSACASLLTARLDFLQMKHLKRKRKSNYSVRETQTLIREIHKRRDVLFSRQQNTAINELKRRAWEEVAGGVNSLGEGELRTSSEVKRRYLDWRSLMKRKQLRAELSLSTGLKAEYDPSSPEHNASLGSRDQSLDLSSFPKESQCDWQDLADLGEPSGHAMSTGVKMEEEANGYRLEGDSGDGEVEEEDDDGDEEEDCFPSLLPDMGERDVRIPEVFSHIDEFGMLSASKGTATSINRDPSLGGMGFAGLGLANHESTGLVVGLEKQRVELEKQRLAVETERLAVERERLLLDKERLSQSKVERERLQLEKERLQLEKERLQLEKERLRLLLMNQSERAAAPPQQGPPSSSTPTTSSSSTVDGPNERKENKPLLSMIDMEGERLSLEKDRLQLEKERLQFFKFESGRLQIERERLEVERMQLHKDQGH